jgi:hypothetical protein
MRRLERQHLPVRAQRGFELGKRRTAARADDQLARLIADDAGAGAGVENLPSDAPP